MKVFVYGSLKQGFYNHSLLEQEGVKLLGMGTVSDLVLVDLGYYPGAIPRKGSMIHGELYDINESVLANLDVLEGHPNYYRRELRLVQREGEPGVMAYVYVLPGTYDNGCYCSGGVWGV